MHEINKVLGNNLRLLRRKRGLSLEKVGARLNITYQQMQKYEKGLNNISATKLYELTKILRVNVEDFFKNLPVQPVVNKNLVISNKEIENLILSYSLISSKRTRDTIIKFINALAQS